MSKVLVDRELLEQIVRLWAVGLDCEKEMRELRDALSAQPAEAEGVAPDAFEVARHSKRLVEQLRAELSAVTAERDRLRDEMGILWKRIDKYENQSHGITALAEIERLRAEVVRLNAELLGRPWVC